MLSVLESQKCAYRTSGLHRVQKSVRNFRTTHFGRFSKGTPGGSVLPSEDGIRTQVADETRVFSVCGVRKKILKTWENHFIVLIKIICRLNYYLRDTLCFRYDWTDLERPMGLRILLRTRDVARETVFFSRISFKITYYCANAFITRT